MGDETQDKKQLGRQDARQKKGVTRHKTKQNWETRRETKKNGETTRKTKINVKTRHETKKIGR